MTLIENLVVSQRSISVWSIGLHGTYKLTERWNAESLILWQLVYCYLRDFTIILSSHVQLGFFLSVFWAKILCAFLVSPLCCKSRPPNTVQHTVHDTKPIFMHFCFSLYFFLCKTQPECLSRYNCLSYGLKVWGILVPFLTKARNFSLHRKVQNNLGPT